MTANLDIASVADPALKLSAFSPSPSMAQSMPDTPISPSLHTIPSHYRHLRQSTLLNWLNHWVPNATPITSPTQLTNGKALVHLVAALSNTPAASTDHSDTQNIKQALDMLQYWRDIPAGHISPEAVASGDQDELFHLLCFILTHYQAHIITALQDTTFAFISSHVHPIISNHALVVPADIQQVILTWCKVTLADYVNASLLPAIHDCGDSWQNGLYFLALLHYYDPGSVSDLYDFLHLAERRDQWETLLFTAFERAKGAFQVPQLLDAHTLSQAEGVDAVSIVAYLTEFLRAVSGFTPPAPDVRRRTDDIQRWSQQDIPNDGGSDATESEPPLSHTSHHASSESSSFETASQETPLGQATTTITATLTQESIRIVKTTKVKPEGVNDLSEFDTRASHVLDKISQLHTRLGLIVPTRSSNYRSTSAIRTPSSATPDALHESSDETESNTESMDSQTRILHPLQAAQEDVLTYQRNFDAFLVTLGALRRDDVEPLLQMARDLELMGLEAGLETNGPDPSVARRTDEVNRALAALENDVAGVEQQLAAFRHGFSFAETCAGVKSELDAIQLTMVKAIVSAPVIDDMERRMTHIQSTVTHIPDQFHTLLDSPDYRHHYDALVERNRCVATWVGEVRIWFAEAERIKQWVEVRKETLESMDVPEPLTSVDFPATPEQVHHWNTTHEALEKEIDAFEKEDMARLRSHVKPLTSDRAGKELSPADTTTIEITLTTLATLDRLMQQFRQKSNTLQTLTFRMQWEKGLADCLVWIADTDRSLDTFLRNSARWRSVEDDLQGNGHDSPFMREQLQAKHRIRELIIQKLLLFESTISDFESGQYSNTVEAFNELFDVTDVDLPDHLDEKQNDLDNRLEALKRRRTFAREVVEQRISVMDFVHQIHIIKNEGQQLLNDLHEARDTARPDDNDRDMVARVQQLNEQIAQVLTSTAGRIPYPTAPTTEDEEHNESGNQEIRQLVYAKHAELAQLSETLDKALAELAHVLKLHRTAKQLTDDANRLKAWATERLQLMRKSAVDMDADAPKLEEWHRLDRERRNLLDKLKGGKERDAIKVLTEIQILLETVDKENVVSMDKQTLSEISQELTEVYDELGEFLEQHHRNLLALRKKMEDGQSYSQDVQQLRAYMNETRASLPGLKQSCGFMTGQSEEQDRRRYDLLNTMFGNLTASHQAHRELLTRIQRCETPEESEHDRAALESDWAALSEEMDELKTFTDKVGMWYNRQRRLSMVENELMAGLNEEINQLAKSGWTNEDVERLEARIQTVLDVLQEVADGFASADTKNDPLETANYSCARDRHATLLSKAQSTLNSLNTLRKNASSALVVSAFLSKADALLKEMQAEKEKVNGRIAAVGSTSQIVRQHPSALDETHKTIQAENKQAETRAKELQQQMHKLSEEARQLSKQGYDERTMEEPAEQVRACFAQLTDAITLERRQGQFVRKLLLHANATQEIHTWITQCAQAIANLPTDVCMVDEAELRADFDLVERRIAGMQPTITAFHEMPKRILTKEGQPIDLCEMQFDSEEVKRDIQALQDSVATAWEGLRHKMNDISDAVQRSARDVDIARRVKEILTMIGHFKDQANGIRLSNGDAEPKEDDVTFVSTCSFTDIPVEHGLLEIKTALSSLESDVEHYLQVKVGELDAILKSNTDSEGIFSGQRTEIGTASQGLTDMLKNKREAVAIAEKLEPFLTVVEELEVLLSAVGEVIERASPEHARVVDGVPSRADLQAMLIDLDTRYWYYEPKINDLINEAKGAARYLTKDKRVVDCLTDMANKWSQLQELAAEKRARLLDRIGPLSDATVPSRLLSMQEKREQTLAKRSSMSSLNGIAPRPMQSTPRLASGARPQSAMATRTPARPQPRPSRLSMVRTLPPTNRRPTRSPLTQRSMVKSPETYVADPKNDLDVALGDIINDSPYKVRVKMMPGTVGKYWFGEVNPKVAYCRILRSRMVMVRVGGGWVELSQFLRDHALLESGNFVSGRAVDAEPSAGTMTVGSTDVVTIRGGGAGKRTNGRNSMPVGAKSSLRESMSTPFHRGSTQAYGHGIKEGNKFLVPVDGEGNRVEVRMTKANSKTTKFTTPRRPFMIN